MSLLNLILLLVGGGLAAWLAERVNPDLPRTVAVVTVAVALVYLLQLVAGLPAENFALPVDPLNNGSWLLHQKVAWIPRFGISLELGMDGLSLLLVILTLLLGLIAIASSWTEIDFKAGFFQANLLWTLAGVCGVFLALDLFLFFLFWEIMLVPMYLLIAIWGHEDKDYASMKFFIFTQASGLLMLLAIVTLAWQGMAANGVLSFSYFDLLGLHLAERVAWMIMLGFFIAFTVKLPGVPFHTWLPDAHTQAPTAGSVLLAGLLLKTGAYGLLRFCIPLFPEVSAQFAPVAMGLGVAGVLYGAILAFAQTDFKRLVAYSSVSHMGFILLGLYAWNTLALQGVVMQILAHGISSAALFMIAGALQQRLHARDMGRMGGLWQQMPRMGACTLYFVLASMALPGFGNFVAEFLILLGLFAVNPWVCALTVLGMITSTIYALWLMQQAFQGPPAATRPMKDFDSREMLTMGAIIVALTGMGLYPQPLIDLVQPALDSLQQLAHLAPSGGLPAWRPI